MDREWKPMEITTGVLSGRAGMTEYALRYPVAHEGAAAFDRWWLKQAEALRRRCIREGGQLPTHWAAEWQETLQSPRAVSGFLDVSRRTGFADWRLLRISATFLAGEPRPAPLSALFLPGRQQQLRPLLEQKLADLARQTETPFYRCPAQGLPAALRSGGYYLTEEGLALWFPQESLAPRNAGLPTVLLPYAALEGLLRFSF